MSLLYTCGFDLSVIDFSITMMSSGVDDINIKFTGSGEANTYYLTDYEYNDTPLYSHLDIHGMDMNNRTTSPLYSTWADDPLEDVLEQALNGGIAGEGWGGAFQVMFNPATGKYLILNTMRSFTLTGNQASLNLLGYIVAQTGTTYYLSVACSSHCVLATQTHLSKVSDEYEPNNVASQAISDGGYPIGMSRTIPIIHMDWYQQFETHEKTHKRKALYEDEYKMPWTFQHFFEHCRTTYPFVVYTQDFWTGFYPVFLLREDGANFRPERDHPDYDGHWHIPFKTYLYGWINA